MQPYAVVEDMEFEHNQTFHIKVLKLQYSDWEINTCMRAYICHLSEALAKVVTEWELERDNSSILVASPA